MTKLTHPGDYLRAELNKRGIKSKEFAKEIGMYAPHLSDLLHGRRRITIVLAQRIAKALGDSIPEYWLEIQNIWDLEQLNKK